MSLAAPQLNPSEQQRGEATTAGRGSRRSARSERRTALAPVAPAHGQDPRRLPNVAFDAPPPGSDSRDPDAFRAASRQQGPTRTTAPRVSVVIPTYNEAKNLPHVMSRLPADLHEVIVVDGRSVDDTIQVARALRPDAKIVLQNRMGKGNAMACGFAAVTGDIVVMLDADGSADPGEIARFVHALTEGADFAKGTRFLDGGGSNDITAVRRWGNRWLNRAANVLFGTRYTDLCYGYNAFWRDCLSSLELDPREGDTGGKLWGDGFEIETIINTRMAKARFRIAEVPSFEYPRVHGESNLNTWRDGMRVLRALVIERFNRVSRPARTGGASTGRPAATPMPTPTAAVPGGDEERAISA
jgi:hypothetical protein